MARMVCYSAKGKNVFSNFYIYINIHNGNIYLFFVISQIAYWNKRNGLMEQIWYFTDE